MVLHLQKMGAAQASRVTSFVAPTPSSVNSSKITLKDAVSTDNIYCHYLGALATTLDRVARMPKLITKSLEASITPRRSRACGEGAAQAGRGLI